MPVAIVGAGGQLGSALVEAFADRAPFSAFHAEYDLEAEEAMDRLFARCNPELVINTAAFHNVERCEREPERAMALNAHAVDRLTRRCERAAIALVHLSTDYVFDGNASRPYLESDPVRPLNAYGISKLAGELFARRSRAPVFVVRTSGLYAARGSSAEKGKPFIERMLDQAQARTPLRVVDDVTFSPSFAPHVAAAIRRIVDRNVPGLYHVSDAGACSWHAFATEALRQAGYECEIERTHASDSAGGVRRPAFSALAHGALEALGLPPMPSWQAGIGEYLAERSRLAAAR